MLYLLPQLKVKGRYQEEWVTTWESELINMNISDYKIILPYQKSYSPTNYFTNEEKAIENELRQISILNKLVKRGDVIFWLDLDYPGFSNPFNYFLRARFGDGIRIAGLLHGAYFNRGDIWSKVDRKYFDKSIFSVVDKVIVGSRSFYNDIKNNLELSDKELEKLVWKPFPFFYKRYTPDWEEKEKANMIVKWRKDNKIEVDGQIFNFLPKETFLGYLSKARVFVLEKERTDTFGYSVLEALASGCAVKVSKKVGVLGDFDWKGVFEDGNVDVSVEDLKNFYSQNLQYFGILEKAGREILEVVINEFKK